MKKKINMQFIIVSFIAIILTMSLSVGTFYELFVQEMRNDMMYLEVQGCLMRLMRKN